jgi:YVTN family beta-propeller protein
VGAGSVWVARGARAELTRINPDWNAAASPIPALGEGVRCDGPRASIAFGAGFLWFVCEVADLGRVNPGKGSAARIGLEADLLTSPSAVSPEFSDVAFGLGSLWIVNRAANAVVEVDPATSRKLREVTVGKRPVAIAVGSGSLWIANFDDDAVTKIAFPGSGQTPTLTTIPVGDGPLDVAVGEGGVWVANSLDGTVSRIDLETGEVVATIGIGNAPQRVAVGEGGVWVTVRAPEEEVIVEP